MPTEKQHEQRFGIQAVDSATGLLTRLWASGKGLWSTLITLLAGERHADSANGWGQVYGSTPRAHEPDLSSANYDAWTLNTEKIVGVVYRGAGGLIIGDTVSGEIESITVLNTAVYGVQVVPCQFTRLYQQGSNVTTERGSETVTAFASDRDATLYLTGNLS